MGKVSRVSSNETQPVRFQPFNNVQHFITKWQNTNLKESAVAKTHFDELCNFLDVDKPLDVDPDGTFYTFERPVTKAIGGKGFADVWKRGHFAWEYKGKKGKLEEAYLQLLLYRDDLENPPLLVVCNIETIQIHTNFTGTPKQVYTLTLQDLANPENLALLKNVFENPEQLNPKYKRERVTQEASQQIGELAQKLQAKGHDAQVVAHFLMQIVFSLFAEDVGLLPNKLATRILEKTLKTPSRAKTYLTQLFEAMATGGEVLLEEVPYFNGGLFEGTGALPLESEELEILWKASKLDWTEVEPSIFGTLFERSLDPAKRSQLGAHYTSREDILKIVEPVILEPLKNEWREIRNSIETQKAKDNKQHKKLVEQPISEFLQKLHTLKVLDPACGSANFLYVAMQQLKELEKEVVTFAWSMGAPGFPLLSPRQFYGYEVNVFAHELASIVVWIGYLQWNHLNGISNTQVPILEKLDNIKRQDALLDGCKETKWVEANYIVGNPPFLGDKKMRRELGDDYVETLRKAYANRVPGQADLVCYWFEKARAQIEAGKAKRAGLISTNSIRGGKNREVLERIKQSGDIFMAWSDEPWVLDGAAVRVSMVGFDNGKQQEKFFNGKSAKSINANLTSRVDVTQAKPLLDNQNTAFIGIQKGGAFEIPGQLAQSWLKLPNPGKRQNSDILKPYLNELDIAGRPSDTWIIDFGQMSLEEASNYIVPFTYVEENVKPERLKNKDSASNTYWWLHQRTRPDMRRAVKELNHYIATPRVAKHRLWVYIPAGTLPDSRLVAIARSDLFTFGILHSTVHETWALATGGWHGVGNDPQYNAISSFETFPFPESTAKQKAEVEKWAKYLDEVRSEILKNDKDLTMTKLYNQLEELRESRDCGHPVYALLVAHEKLDQAVHTAYGWEYPLADEVILERLLALNLERAHS
jgi:type II restriction/modification system DNA methylase subunit YeeA